MPKSFMANGNIQPNTAVQLDQTAKYKVIAGNATTTSLIGIAQDGTVDPPGVNGSLGNAARAGIPLMVYVAGDECNALVGANWACGDKLVSNATAGLEPANLACNTTITQIAEALTSAVAGEYARVLVLSPVVARPA